MSMTIDYKGWKFLFEKMPTSADIEAKYQAYVRATEVSLPLPSPTPLERLNGPRANDELANARIEYFGPLDGALADALRGRGAEVTCTQDTAFSRGELAALVIDLRGRESFDALDAAFAFLHARVMALKKSGRVVFVTQPATQADSAEMAGAREAIDGFVRALARELGVSGTTVNRVEVDPDASASGAVAFLVSKHAAYVDGQVFRVRASEVQDAAKPGERLAGKVAVVTGATRGIGRAAAVELAREGAAVVWVDLPADNRHGLPGTEKALESLVREHGGRAVCVDVADPEAAAMIAASVEELGGVDIVVNNAGVVADAMFFTMTPDAWRRVMQVNLHAPTRLVDHLDSHGLLRDGGALVFVASVAGLAGNPGQVNYSASKAGVIGVAKHFAQKLAHRGIRSNAVAAGTTETVLLQTAPEWIRAIGVRLNALSQVGQPSDTGNLIAFLCGDASAGISGECIRCCGAALQGA